MKKLCFMLSMMMCFLVQYGYAQTTNYDYNNSNVVADGCCPQEHQCGDCYCLYCRYKPCYYNVQKCEYCPKTTYQRCCRYCPKYYQVQCCRYVPQYYCRTCCKYCPEYYYTCNTCQVPHYYCEKHCKYEPCYYYKHVCNQPCRVENNCAPACPTSGCPASGSVSGAYNDSYNTNYGTDYRYNNTYSNVNENFPAPVESTGNANY